MRLRLTLFQKQALSFVATFIFIYFIGGQNWVMYGSIFVMIAVHELGHLGCSRYLGYPTKGMFMTPLGGIALLTTIPLQRMHQFWIWWWGPFVGFLETLILFLVNNLFIHRPDASLIVFLWAWINFINLFPLFPLDGGRIVQSIMSGKNEEYLSSMMYITLTGISCVFLSRFSFLFIFIILFFGWQQRTMTIDMASILEESIDENGHQKISRVGWKNNSIPMTLKEVIVAVFLYLGLFSGLGLLLYFSLN